MNHAALNRSYRLVWSRVNNCWVAVAETAKGRGKSSTTIKRILTALFLSPALAFAGLEGASIVGGEGAIINPNLVQQDSSRLAIHAQGFGVGLGETFTLRQQYTSDVALIRVLGQNPSDIFGSIQAKGQLFISNPNGILFGPESQINVGGLVGTTLDISREQFMAGNYTFSNSGHAGSVVNQGTLTAADGGYIALLAPQVRNEGVIRTTMGTSLIGAGDEVTLNISNSSLLSYTIDKGAVNAMAENRQLVHADGGQIYMGAKAADDLSVAVVNNTGIAKAAKVSNNGGVISLQADYAVQTGSLDVSGTEGAGDINIEARNILDAGQAKANSSQGNGGNITYHANSIIQTASARTEANSSASNGIGGTVHLQAGNNFYSSGTISATGKGTSGKGGTIDTLGNRVVLAAATLDASGTSQGGTVRVGGDFHGTNPDIQSAQTTIINGATNIKADGGKGQVVVWSDDKTDFYGNVSADKAGMIEVSSKGTLTYSGNATAGQGGQLLLDPANIIISSSGSSTTFTELITPNRTEWGEFGSDTFSFENGNLLVVESNSDVNGIAGAGAVYLFNQSNGSLISMLTGSHVNDRVGGMGVTDLNNGNVLVGSYAWNEYRGALTYFDGTTGLSGIVSSQNSLVGTTANDYVGQVRALKNGNYLAITPNWNGYRGAVTFLSKDQALTGEISAHNSLVGTISSPNWWESSRIGGPIYDVGDSNYLIAGNDPKGSVTWGSGTTGVVGEVSVANSLIGTGDYDYLGGYGMVTVLPNGNAVIRSRLGDQLGYQNSGMGSVTLINGQTGEINNQAGVKGGLATADNSLIGAVNGVAVGSGGIEVLNNGNFLILTPNYRNSDYQTVGVKEYGSISFQSADQMTTGVLSASNSLVGSPNSNESFAIINMHAGINPITKLSNGGYIIATPLWNSGRGAVTYGDGVTPLVGQVSASNSLVGTQPDIYGYWWSTTPTTYGDRVGTMITPFANGNYVVGSPNWNSRYGATTFQNVIGGQIITGAVSTANSFIGNAIDSNFGYRINGLRNGNYLVQSYGVNSGGAITLFNGESGEVYTDNGLGTRTGSQSLNNSLFEAGMFPAVLQLGESHYVLAGVKSSWDPATSSMVGQTSLTVVDANVGVFGNVSTQNSYVGSLQDGLGQSYYGDSFTELPNGKAVVASPNWDGGKGAWTFIDPSKNNTGTISASNSLVGTQVGNGLNSNVTPLANGNYLVVTRNWNNNQGALTWGSSSQGVAGEISPANSLTGISGGNANYYGTPNTYQDGSFSLLMQNALGGKGAVFFSDGTQVITGEVSANNSIVGSHVGDFSNAYVRVRNSDYWSPWVNTTPSGIAPYAFLLAPSWNGGRGAFTQITPGMHGELSSSNSLVGTRPDSSPTIQDGDRVADWDVIYLNDKTAMLVSSQWNQGRGAITKLALGEPNVVGELSSSNSLVGNLADSAFGARDGSHLGSYWSYDLGNGATFVFSDMYGGDLGAVTLLANDQPWVGEISTANTIFAQPSWDRWSFDTTWQNYQGFYKGAQPGAENGSAIITFPWSADGGHVFIGRTNLTLPVTFGYLQGEDINLNATSITQTLAAGTDVTLQASNDITVNQNILVSGSTGSALTMQAGRNINLNAQIVTANGDFTAIAGDPGAIADDRLPGTPTITLGSGASINAGTGTVILNANGGNFVNNSGSSSPITANQWFVYSTDPALNTLGGMVGNKRYNQPYTGTTPDFATSGNWLMYSIAPILSVSPSTQIVYYGNSPAAFTPGFRGFIDGDTIDTAGITGTALFSGAGTEIGYYDIYYVSGLASSLGYGFINRAASVDELIVAPRGATIVPRPTNGANAYWAANNVPYNISPTTSQMGNEGFVRTTDADHRYALTEVVAFERDASGAAVDINTLDFDGNGSTYEVRSTGKVELVLEDGGIHLPDDLIDSSAPRKSTIQGTPRVIRTKQTL